MREYKIYLPLKYNDGQDIEEDKLKEIKTELVDAFGAITVSSVTAPYHKAVMCLHGTIEGKWL